MTRICVWGDSIAYGNDDVEGGWCDRLKRYCNEKDSNQSIYDVAISGDNTDKLLKRFPTEVSARDPDVIIFAIE